MASINFIFAIPISSTASIKCSSHYTLEEQYTGTGLKHTLQSTLNAECTINFSSWSQAFSMCIIVRVRHTCQHLGRVRGFESCDWYDAAEELVEAGVSDRDNRVIANDEQCRGNTSHTYRDVDTLCVNCMEQEMQDGEGSGTETVTGHGTYPDEEESGAIVREEFYDENRDSLFGFFPWPHPLYDSRKKVKFSVGPSSSGSSAPSEKEPSSRLFSFTKFKKEKLPSDDGLLLYPKPRPRFDYPIGDLIMKDMTKFETFFNIQPPDSDNWIFSSGDVTRCMEFAHFKNALDPACNAKHLGDMYPNDFVQIHLMKYLRRENHWKAWAFSFHRFACTAKGHVHVLLPRDCKDPLHPYPDNAGGPVDSHWELYELWALTRMGRVKIITSYNSDDFSEVGILWRAGQPILGEPPDFWIGPRLLKENTGTDHALYSSALTDSR